MKRGIQENVGGVEGKSRITFSVEQKQDGNSILPLCHWQQDRPRIVLPNITVLRLDGGDAY